MNLTSSITTVHLPVRHKHIQKTLLWIFKTLARNSLRTPGYRDIDLGIFRNFKLYRETQLQFRAEATNAFNMVSLGSPTLTSPATISATTGQ